MIRELKLALSVTLLASAAYAQMPIGPGSGPARPSQPTEERDAKRFQNLVLPGRKVAPAVRKLRKLKWHKRLGSAQSVARSTGKPILWLQVLGTLKGYT